MLSTLRHLIYVFGYALCRISWWWDIAIVSGVGALRFKSRADQSNTVLPMAHHHCDIFLKVVVLLGCNDMEMGHGNSLHASIYCSNYSKKFGLISFMISSKVAVFRFLSFLQLNKLGVMYY